MGIFIKVEIDTIRCEGIQLCGKCIQVCPVNIFEKKNSRLVIVEKNEDECTLCTLCINVCKINAININKLYL